jgi:predicted nucleic acid-binding protein
MPIIVDASLMVRLAARGDWVDLIDAKLGERQGAGETLHAPDLLPYEVESAMRSFVFHRSPDRGAGHGTRAAYDAAYLALAEHLDAELWTCDRRLANGGRSLGLRTHFIGEVMPDEPSG